MTYQFLTTFLQRCLTSLKKYFWWCYTMMLNLLLHFFHCMKSVQIRSYFWSVFSCIQSEYRKIRIRYNSVFGHFSRSVLLSYYWNFWQTSLTQYCKSISQEDDLISLLCISIRVITFKIFLIENLFLEGLSFNMDFFCLFN